MNPEAAQYGDDLESSKVISLYFQKAHSTVNKLNIDINTLVNLYLWKEAKCPSTLNLTKYKCETSLVKKSHLKTAESSITSRKVSLKNRIKHYRKITLDAFQGKKIFMIYGNYPAIQEALLKRGWLEKLISKKYKYLHDMTLNYLLENMQRRSEFETVAISKLMKDYPAFFIWQPKNRKDHYEDIFPYRNRIRRNYEFDFTTKEGLINCIDSSHFFTWENVSGIRTFRCFKLASDSEIQDFRQDYRLTCCKSLVLFVAEKSAEKSLYGSNGTIPLFYIDFAIKKIEDSISVMENMDIDTLKEDNSLAASMEWEKFITNTYWIINEVDKFKANKKEFSVVLNKCVKIIAEAERYWPSMRVEGFNNVWIVKPAFTSCGRGIVITQNYDKIILLSKEKHKMHYCVQKYLERPLLIYKTKFDIRQYSLVTVNKEFISIWLYKDCYLKFSSQEFNLKDFRECVHITNNTVQRKYKNGKRSTRLPSHNMWKLAQFRNYLKILGKRDAWENQIYPEMKENVIAVILSSLDESNLVINQFEFSGFDFILDENCNLYLIEINSSPDMAPTTSVTAEICPAVLEDVIKVVVDFPMNSKVSTGDFELIFKLPYDDNTLIQPDLAISGRRIGT